MHLVLVGYKIATLKTTDIKIIVLMALNGKVAINVK
jgi:hypothetical protein